MDGPALLQTGPEEFQLLTGDGRRRRLLLAHHTRRGLGVSGTPPLAVAEAIVDFLLERDALPGTPEIALGVVAGQFPEFVEEVRARLA